MEPSKIIATAFGHRHRTDLTFVDNGTESSVLKSYHLPNLSAKVRRLICAKLIDSGYEPLTIEDQVKYEVARLKLFSERDIKVPKIYEVGQTFYRMEWLPYPSADQQLREGRTEVVDNVLLSLDDLHCKGLTHGDFNPSNVLPITPSLSALIDPGQKFKDDDSTTGKFKDLARALFGLSYHIYELAPVCQSLRLIYKDQETLRGFLDFLKTFGNFQRLLTNLVFRDGAAFSRVQKELKAALR